MPANTLIPTILTAPPDAQAAASLARQRLPEIAGLAGPLGLRLVARPGDRITLTLAGTEATISAAGTRGFVAGVGLLIRELLRAADDPQPRLPQGQWEERPALPERTHYMPAHFGNSFEVAYPREFRRTLEDLALWGSSGYGDWFDPNDMPDPYAPHVYCSSSMTLWERKKQNLRAASELGLETGLWIAHNVGFLDQLHPAWVGQRSLKKRVQGQVLCPSIPEARAVILRNHENLMADLVASGVHLDRLNYGPYDDGGCACPKCEPYYPIFLRMVVELHEIARRYFPDIQADLVGWWVSDEEMALIRDFVAGPARPWFRAFQFSATYGVNTLPDLKPLLGDLPVSTFYHIGFSRDRSDVYIRNGLHSAPARIHEFIGSLPGRGCLGFVSYNEGFCDQYNEFLVTRQACDPAADPRALTDDFVRQIFGLRGQDRARLTALLLELETLDGARAANWLTTLDALAPRVTVPPWQPWAYEHLRLKAALLALDHQIGDGKAWQTAADAERARPLVAQYLELADRLWRQVYGLGILRHIFVPDFMLPDWYKRFTRHFPEPRGHIIPSHTPGIKA